MSTTFHRLNEGRNAEPSALYPAVDVHGEDIVLKFFVNAFRFPDFEQDEKYPQNASLIIPPLRSDREGNAHHSVKPILLLA
jgi:hypothetical protein